MNVVKDIQEFVSFMQSRDEVRDEVIIFPIGAEGQQLLEFLKYTNFLRKVCCAAMPQLGPDNATQIFIHELPVIPFEHLVHFRETAVFIVAGGGEKYYQNLNEELTRWGARKILFISSALQAQIQDALQRMASTGQIMMWFMNHFDEKITRLEHKIAEQNEVSKVNTKAFAEYRNAFHGKKVVLVGNGPTLNYYKPNFHAINIGLNFASKNKNLPPDYLFTMDGRGMTTDALKLGGLDFDKVRCKIFRGKFVERCSSSWQNFSESVVFQSQNIVNFFVNDNSLDQIIYQDICNHPLPDFYSIVTPAFNFALFTNPEKIYLVGCDTADNGHFYDKKDQKSTSLFTFSKLKAGYARMKMFARVYYPETEIISINPVGLKGLFKDVYTDEYLKALEENQE